MSTEKKQIETKAELEIRVVEPITEKDYTPEGKNPFIIDTDPDDIPHDPTPGTPQLRTPKGDEWFQAHETDRLVHMLALSAEGSGEARDMTKILTPKVARHVGSHARVVVAVLCVNRFGQHFFWPLKRSKDGKPNTFNDSNFEVLAAARKGFVQRENMGREFQAKPSPALKPHDWGGVDDDALFNKMAEVYGISDPGDPIIVRLLTGL